MDLKRKNGQVNALWVRNHRNWLSYITRRLFTTLSTYFQ